MSDAAGLYDRPVLVLDQGMHTAPIIRADVDRIISDVLRAKQRRKTRHLLAVQLHDELRGAKRAPRV